MGSWALSLFKMRNMAAADTVGAGVLVADRWGGEGGVKRLNYLQTFFLMCSIQSCVKTAPPQWNSRHKPEPEKPWIKYLMN